MTPAAQNALDELLALPKIQSYASYQGARGKCFEAAYTAAIWFRTRSVPVRIVRFTNPRVVTPFSREAILEANSWHDLHDVELASGRTIPLNNSERYHLRRLEQHAVELEGSVVVDLTWRAWQPSGEFPRISSVAEYAIDFEVDETMCGHCGALEGDPCHHPSHWVEDVFTVRLRQGVAA